MRAVANGAAATARSRFRRPDPKVVRILSRSDVGGDAIYNASCEQMAELADGVVDLIVTSPPYWVDPQDPLLGPALLRNGGRETPESFESLVSLLLRCFAECQRVLKPGGYLAVNVATTIVGGRLYPLPHRLVLDLQQKQGWRFREEIIWRRYRGWDKRGGVLIQNPYPGYWFPNRVHEFVLIFQKPGGAPIYQGRTEAEKEASRIAVDSLFVREVNYTLWNILPVRPQGRKGHPCPFPDELAYRLITLYSYKGDLVLDPFTGSGTTLKVARLLGRRYVGYELNPQFFALAKERVRESTLQRHRVIARFENLDGHEQQEERHEQPHGEQANTQARQAPAPVRRRSSRHVRTRTGA